jgi:hypothetical protein
MNFCVNIFDDGESLSIVSGAAIFNSMVSYWKSWKRIALLFLALISRGCNGVAPIIDHFLKIGETDLDMESGHSLSVE